MKLVGLTGSIASGKSTAARILRDLQIPVFDSDETVHRLYADGTVAKLLPRKFASVIAEKSRIDREKLSKLLERHPEYFADIETVVHPLVRAAQEAFIASCRAKGEPLAVVDIPLLFESHQENRFDHIVLVTAQAEKRRERALQRAGMTEDKFSMIDGRQMPESEKRKRASHVIDNNGTIQDLAAAIETFVRDMKKEEQ